MCRHYQYVDIVLRHSESWLLMAMVEAAEDRVTAPAPGYGHLVPGLQPPTRRILILVSSLTQCAGRTAEVTYETYERPREMRSESGKLAGWRERGQCPDWLQPHAGELVPTVFTFTLGTRPCYHHHRLILHNHTCLLTVCVQCGHTEQFHRGPV